MAEVLYVKCDIIQLFIWQEARRLNSAIIANIHFNEWIPVFVGPRATKRFHLEPQTSGFYEGFSSRMNPQVM